MCMCVCVYVYVKQASRVTTHTSQYAVERATDDFDRQQMTGFRFIGRYTMLK